MQIESYDVDVPEGFALPALASGLIWSDGWEIPQIFAVDSNKNCYANDAHGGRLELKRTEGFLFALRGHRMEAVVRQVLGRKPRFPNWARTALSEGWTPPKSWNENDYEK